MPSTSLTVSKRKSKTHTKSSKEIWATIILGSDLKQFLSHNLEAELAPFHSKLQGIFESVEPLEEISMWGGSNSD